jgi:hypothetical protein
MDYKQKYLKYKQKYLKYKQIGGNSVSYPNILDEHFLDFIANQIKYTSYLSKLPLDDGTELGLQGRVLRSIRSGGTGSFTNKIQYNDRKKMITFDTILNLNELYDNTIRFMNIAKTFSDKYLSPESNHYLFNNFVKVYRFVNISIPHNIKQIIQPIPMSASWAYDFSKSWSNKQTCCIYEIILRQNTEFITLSYPDISIPSNAQDIQFYQDQNKYKLLNQEQLEIVLPPCILVYKQIRTQDGINIITFDLNPIPQLNIREIFQYVLDNGIFILNS